LNIARYVDTFEQEEEIDLKAVQAEIRGLEKQLADTRSEIIQRLAALGL
jgi:type I restriction enzyme M protein